MESCFDIVRFCLEEQKVKMSDSEQTTALYPNTIKKDLFTTDIRFHFLTLQVLGLDKSIAIVGLKITHSDLMVHSLSILVYQLLK